MREQIKKPYSQVLVWSGTVIGDTPVKEFNKFFKDEFGVRVNFIEEIVTSPDLDDKGYPIEGTGGRHDVLFSIHEDNVNGKTRHVDWHKYARVQKRNTTQGDVIWI
jgi:hypothetical protein